MPGPPIHVIQVVYLVAADGTPIHEVGGSTVEARWFPRAELDSMPVVDLVEGRPRPQGRCSGLTQGRGHQAVDEAAVDLVLVVLHDLTDHPARGLGVAADAELGDGRPDQGFGRVLIELGSGATATGNPPPNPASGPSPRPRGPSSRYSARALSIFFE